MLLFTRTNDPVMSYGGRNAHPSHSNREAPGYAVITQKETFYDIVRDCLTLVPGVDDITESCSCISVK